MVPIAHADLSRLAERYIRIHGRQCPTIFDAGALAARLHSKLPEAQARRVSRQELVRPVIARAAWQVSALRW